MAQEVFQPVSAGIDMEFVRDLAGGEQPVERVSAGVKAEFVVEAAIEINL